MGRIETIFCIQHEVNQGFPGNRVIREGLMVLAKISQLWLWGGTLRSNLSRHRHPDNSAIDIDLICNGMTHEEIICFLRHRNIQCRFSRTSDPSAKRVLVENGTNQVSICTPPDTKRRLTLGPPIMKHMALLDCELFCHFSGDFPGQDPLLIPNVGELRRNDFKYYIYLLCRARLLWENYKYYGKKLPWPGIYNTEPFKPDIIKARQVAFILQKEGAKRIGFVREALQTNDSLGAVFH